MRKSIPGVLFLLAAIATVAAYGHTLKYGFQYDDYHFVRPWTVGELGQVLHGSWDPTKIESDFFRPLAAWWFALRFELFGLNGVAQHAVSLAGMITCAWLAGLFAWRELQSPRAAVITTVLYAIHPAFAYSQAIWLTNQMHLLASALVLIALLVWQRVRTRRALEWWPLGLVAIAGCGIKEDLVMLPPLLLALGVLRALVRRDVPIPPLGVVAAALGLPVAFFALRYELLGRLGGYGPLPAAPRAWSNFTSGLLGVFRQVPARRPWQPFASNVSQTILVAGALGALLRRREAQLFLTGLIVALAFNAPFVFVTKAEQYHLVALGAVFALAGGLEIVATLFPAPAAQTVIASAGLLATLSFLPVTKNVATDFAPCSPITLRTDAIVTEWWPVPPEIQDWLQTKPAACRAGGPVPLPKALTSATWAYGAQPDETGLRCQWTGDRAVVMVSPRAGSVNIGIRRPGGSEDAPVTVRLSGPASVATARLTSSDWQVVTVPLAPTLMSWVRGMTRVDIDVSPTFVPAEVNPASLDRRHLGILLRVDSIVPR